ncbi:hypothetical protein GCM10018966_003970 [Streptomyces yanii]
MPMCPGGARCADAVRPSTIRSAPGAAWARASREVGEDLSGGPCAGRERTLYGTGRPVVAAHVPAPREARRAAERPRWRHGRQRAVDGVRGDACPSGPREPTRWRTMEAEPEPDLVAADRSVSTCPVHRMASTARSRGCVAPINGKQTIGYPMGIHS